MRRLRDDENGAIALLALAGILITFMTALVIFDAGFAVRHKFKAQIAADAGAFSQAATKARVMNTVAYLNVAKRTLVGIWTMYTGMMWQFYRDVRGRVACAYDLTEDDRLVGDFDLEARSAMREHAAEINAACEGGADQYEVFLDEANRFDWVVLADTEIEHHGYRAVVTEYDTGIKRMWRSDVRRLDEMQDSLLEAAPKWSMTEGMVRARASGAEYVDAFSTPLPSRKGIGTQTCLRGRGHLDGSIATGPELVAEIDANRSIHAEQSVPASRFKEWNETSNLDAGQGFMGTVGCASIGANMDELHAPWVPTVTRATDPINTARDTPLEQYRSDHFEFMEGKGDLGHPEVPPYEGVSCGEIEDLRPEFRGFRASWVARIAPVGNCRPADAGWWK